MKKNSPRFFRKLVALILASVLGAGSASAGLLIRGAEGITMTGADGVRYEQTNGITMTGADALLGFNINNISTHYTDGITMTGADGITMTGADGTAFMGTNAVRANQADGITMTGADGITMTGADGITMTGADGTTYRANAVTMREADGITMTGADGIVMTGADGITMTGADGITMTGADGITMTGADGITMTGADAITATGLDGLVFSIPPNGITMTGADGITMTGADGITMTGADGLTLPVTNGITMTGADAGGHRVGLQSFDPVLAKELERATDDSHVNAVVVYHQWPTDADIEDLKRRGITGGTRFRFLPMVVITAAPQQIADISKLPSVRAVWGNRTLQWAADNSHELTGVARVRTDSDLTNRHHGAGLPVTGRGVTVAVIDTGLDASHPDLANRVVRSVKLADLQGTNPTGFSYPVNVEALGNTDQVNGHGTFVSGVVAGDGTRSNGKHAGVAPGAQIVGLSAGDASLFYVLAGYDYLLQHGAAQRVRVVNCSFSANTHYDANDPVNVATRMLVERGVNVVFSAGNAGPALETLNPYAAAPWVISVGATDQRGRLADFSARGTFASQMFRPTLVAPGVSVVSLRSAGAVNLTGINGLVSRNDTQQLSTAEMPYYTTASGTSFSAPQVAGTIALMLEANPDLTPAQIRDILQRTATPLAPLYAHEVGAGMLNAHAAVLEAAFPERRMGQWRATLDRGQVRFVKDPLQKFSGTVTPGASHNAGITVPEGALHASVQIAWGPMWTVNDLSMMVYDSSNGLRAHVNSLNTPALTGRRERALIKMPVGGAWRVRVSNTLGLVGTAQEYQGTLDVARVEYAALQDVAALGAGVREKIRRVLRTFVMFPSDDYFRPDYGVTRAELAATLVRGARIPQYMPARPTFADVTDATTMNAVESVQAAPGGALFHDAAPGSAFHPDALTSRVTAAIVLVRAAGLRDDAENNLQLQSESVDWNEIPLLYRSYVATALAHGLLTLHTGSLFHPQAALTRAELAHAMTVIAARASE